MRSGYSGRNTDNEADNLLVAAGRWLIHKGVMGFCDYMHNETLQHMVFEAEDIADLRQ